ncbi:MAG TPA: hypothetical protein VK575_12860 [Gemmatimonadaceae bacterium]|nr:hypothetical protein [Gemmatimonadaceae bacterium]
MRSTLLCLTLLVSLAACETSTDALIGIPGGGGGLTTAQATGNWSFTVQRTSALACTSGSLANGQVLTARLDVLSDGTLASTSFWQNPPTTLVRPLTGSVALASGSSDFFMFASSGSTGAMELQGTMTAAGSFSGTLSDPAAGSFQVFGACSYTVGGTKTG